MTFNEKLAQKSIKTLLRKETDRRKYLVLWDTGVESTTILSLLREAFEGVIPFRVGYIDTGQQYIATDEFRHYMVTQWDFVTQLSLIHYSQWSPKKGISPLIASVAECCHQLKTEALLGYCKEHEINVVLSPDFFESERIPSTFLNPIEDWTEVDVWLYTKSREIPFNPLYQTDFMETRYGVKGRRYKTINCTPCVLPIVSKASTIDEIITELTEPGFTPDGDTELIKERLRALGYIE